MLSAARAVSTAMATAVIVAAIGVDVLFSACGGPTGPTPETPRLTVTISEGGVTPAILKAPICTRAWCTVYLRFVNQDSEPHDVRSDPHPEHTGCRQLNTAIGIIAPGETKETEISGCQGRGGYHDETRPDDPRFSGRVE